MPSLSTAAGSSAVLERIALVTSASIPGAVAAAHLALVPGGARDAAVVRVVGLGADDGVWRGADALFCAAWQLAPIGTRAFRAELGTCFASALAGAVLYVLARAILAACADLPRLGPIVAAIASLTATLSNAWQLEATTPGGATIIAALALVPLAAVGVAATVPDLGGSARSLGALGALAIGAALASDPIVGAAALAGAVTTIALGRASGTTGAGGAGGARGTGRTGGTGAGARAAAGAWPSRADAWRLAVAVAMGGAPVLAYAWWRRGAAELVVPGRVLSLRPLLGPRVALVDFAHAQIGWVSLALVATGLVVAALVPRARPAAAGAAAAAIVAALGAMAGDAGAGLVAVAAAFVLAGVGMQAVVRAVATARVPFAAASAMMIVVLELAFPAVALDEATYAVDDRDKTAGAPWAEETFGALAARPVVAVRGEASWRRVLAATATGEMRGDALLLPFDDLSTRAAVRALSREPALAAVFHDVALEGRPGEFALAQLATTRTLALPFAPSDDRSLARHLVPAGAVDRFLPEPHGTSDRRRALEAFLPGRERLARAIAAPRGDPTLAAATATLLRARVLGLAAANDRELMPRALDDLRAFAPTDEVAAEVTRRVILSRTPIDVTTLPTAPR